MIMRSTAIALMLTVLAIGVRAQEAPPDLDKLKAEYALLVKTMEAAQLKVQLHQTQLQLVQLMLQEAQGEAQAIDQRQRAFAERVREALGATEKDEIDYQTMTVRKPIER